MGNLTGVKAVVGQGVMTCSLAKLLFSGERKQQPNLSNGVQKGPPIGVEEGPPFRII